MAVLPLRSTVATSSGCRGACNAEFRLVVFASLRMFGHLAIIGYVCKTAFARVYVAIAFPIGLLLPLPAATPPGSGSACRRATCAWTHHYPRSATRST
jgi:hypothetical protein